MASLPWHKAMNINELGGEGTVGPDRNPRSFERWAKTFGSGGLDSALDALGLDPTHFRELVESSMPIEPPAEPPAWVREADERLVSGRSPRSPGEEYLVTEDSIGLIRPVLDLLRGYQRALHARVDRAVSRSDDTRLSHLAPLLAAAWPASDLSQLMGRTMVLELNVARVEGRLNGSGPDERYESYLELLREDPIQHALWSEYPVLLRKIVNLLSGWLASRAEFAERLVDDLDDLDDLVGGLYRITAVEFGAGDTHRGGRSVAVVDFSGQRLVYKPRSLAVDSAWSAVIDWFNTRAPERPLITPRNLDRSEHGWSTFIEHRPCPKDEADDFYWRMGALLALNYALCGTDVHHENIIASGSCPVMIDMEALFHGTQPTSEADIQTDPAHAFIAEGVISVGLLPSKMVVRDGQAAHTYDPSAVSSESEQQSLIPVSVIKEAGTDQMAFASEYVTMSQPTTNRPHTDGVQLNPLDHTETFVAGFTFTYRAMLEDRETWSAEEGLIARFHGAEVRHIPRPTAFYAVLLEDSTHPDYLRDGREQDRFLARVAFGADGSKEWEPLALSEMAELRSGDIPFFSCRPNGTGLTDGQGHSIPSYLDEPPAATVRSRFLNLSDDDLRAQVMFIRRTFDSIQPTLGGPTGGELLDSTGSPLNENDALEGALRIAHELCDEAVERHDDLGWVSLQFVDETFWQVGSAPTDMYAGLSGLGLFLSQAAQISGDPRIRRFAERTAQTAANRGRFMASQLARQGEDSAVDRVLSQQADSGAFGVVGGLIYYLSHAAVIHGQEDLLDAAEECLPTLRRHIGHDKRFDVVSGGSGAILAALALHSVRPDSEALSVAEHAASILLSRAKETPDGIGWTTFMGPDPLSGMSHGNAGTAYALFRLHEIIHRPEYRRAAELALHHERTMLDTDTGNWADVRFPEAGGQDRPGLSWCHGAPGIGLSRVGILNTAGAAGVDDLLREDLAIAERTTAGFHLPGEGTFRTAGHNGICHGDLGNLEFLLLAARHRDDEAAAESVLRAAGTLYARSREHGWSMGLLAADSLPGLMFGRAGIGYNLLRLAFPLRVPSVLLLETP